MSNTITTSNVKPEFQAPSYIGYRSVQKGVACTKVKKITF